MSILNLTVTTKRQNIACFVQMLSSPKPSPDLSLAFLGLFGLLKVAKQVPSTFMSTVTDLGVSIPLPIPLPFNI